MPHALGCDTTVSVLLLECVNFLRSGHGRFTSVHQRLASVEPIRGFDDICEKETGTEGH